MDVQQRGILTLIRCGLTGETLAVPEGFDLETAAPVLIEHGMSALAYEGALRCGLSKEIPSMRKLFMYYCSDIVRSEKQLTAIDCLCAAFEQAGIDFLPLKGCNLKKLYPKPELRPMDDADILIRMEQYDEISPVLREFGYTQLGESDHELRWRSRELYLELHKRLVAPKEREFFAYFDTGWTRAKRAVEGEHRFCFSTEDELIFQTMHFAKHYRESGIGLKHAVDFWVFTRVHTNLDQTYLCTELRKLHLWEFYQNVLRMVSVWFEDLALDEKSAFMTDMLFRRGMFDARVNRTISDAIGFQKERGDNLKGTRFWWGMWRLFPPCSELSKQYPVLNRCPLFLPGVWVVRWGSKLLFQRDRIAGAGRNMQNITAERVHAYQQALNYVGLDFHFHDKEE